MNIIQQKQDETSPGAQPLSTVTPLEDTARRYRSTTPLATADDRDRQGQSIVTAADNSDSLCATLQRNHAITAGSSRAVAFD